MLSQDVMGHPNINVSEMLRHQKAFGTLSPSVQATADYDYEDQALTLEDFDSRRLKITTVPMNATQTVRGSKLIRPLIEPIAYSAAGRQLRQATVEEFKLSEHDKKQSEGLTLHVKDHIKQNIAIAPIIREQKNLDLCFKRTVLNK